MKVSEMLYFFWLHIPKATADLIPKKFWHLFRTITFRTNCLLGKSTILNKFHAQRDLDIRILEEKISVRDFNYAALNVPTDILMW